MRRRGGWQRELTPGADTTLVADRFLIWVLRNGRCGRDETCARVAALYADRLLGLEPSGDIWLQERGAAAACAAYAARAAAAAASAADAADAAACASASARASFWRQAADVLIEVLSRCEVAA